MVAEINELGRISWSGGSAFGWFGQVQIFPPCCGWIFQRQKQVLTAPVVETGGLQENAIGWVKQSGQ